MAKSEFKWRHFTPELILWCVRWYGTTAMSYANLSDMLAERGVFVNRSTIYRWFIHYGPILHKKLSRYQFTRIDSFWQLDETYVKVFAAVYGCFGSVELSESNSTPLL